MSIRQKLLKEIESTPEHLLTDVINFVRLVKSSDIASPQINFVPTTTLLEKLEKLDGWQGDDLEECLLIVQNSRLLAQF